MIDEKEYLKEISRSKINMRKDLVALPYAEKIRRVVEMQRLVRTFHRDKSKKFYVWDIE